MHHYSTLQFTVCYSIVYTSKFAVCPFTTVNTILQTNLLDINKLTIFYRLYYSLQQ